MLGVTRAVSFQRLRRVVFKKTFQTASTLQWHGTVVSSSSRKSFLSSTTAINTDSVKGKYTSTIGDDTLHRKSSTTALQPKIKTEEELKESAFETTTEKSSSNSSSLYRLLQFSKPEWHLIALSASSLGVTSSITLLLPFASGQVIDHAIQSMATDGTMMVSPMVFAGGLFSLSAVAGGGVYLRSLLLARAGNRIVARLKQKLYDSLLQQEMAFYDNPKNNDSKEAQSTGDLLSRLSSDAHSVQSAITTQAVSALRGTVMSIGAATMLVYTSPVLALVSCGTLPPIFIATRRVGQSLQEQQKEVQELQGEAVSIAEQALSNLSTVQQFNAQQYESNKYHNAVAKAHIKQLETAHLQAQLEATAHVAANGAVLGVLGYGGSLVLQGTISAGDLTGFMMYSLLLAGNISGLTSLYADFSRALAASNRVFELLERTPLIVSQRQKQQRQNDQSISSVDSLRIIETENMVSNEETGEVCLNPDNAFTLLSIDFNDVNFSYPSRPESTILKNFNLTIEPGENIALVGSSGSGKSTVANLLTRMYDLQENDEISGLSSRILIDGRSIRDFDPDDLRQMIGVVSQQPVLFQGTIQDNIIYGSRNNSAIKQDNILEVARMSHVLEFTNNKLLFPDGLNTMVGPRGGSQLSGGQRQRIAIARVLLRNSPIVILDEATSALDAQSEYQVQMAMNALFKTNRTVISIAHRLSTIRHAHRIAVVDQGRIVQIGTFSELTSTEGPFRDLMKTQLIDSRQ